MYVVCMVGIRFEWDPRKDRQNQVARSERTQCQDRWTT